MGLGVGDQLLHGAAGTEGLTIMTVTGSTGRGDRREIPHRVVGQVLRKENAGDVGAGRSEENRIAVGGGARHRLGADHAVRAAGFSTNTGCPSACAIFGAISRARMSVPFPGGNGTTIRNGLAGTIVNTRDRLASAGACGQETISVEFVASRRVLKRMRTCNNSIMTRTVAGRIAPSSSRPRRGLASRQAPGPDARTAQTARPARRYARHPCRVRAPRRGAQDRGRAPPEPGLN